MTLRRWPGAPRRIAVGTLIILLLPAAAIGQRIPLIEGRVVSDANGAALPRVRVSLTTNAPGADPVLSDDQGRFVLPIPASVTADTVSFTAAKAGYAAVTQSFTRSTAAAAPITLRLVRGAAISGVVTESTGAPSVSMLVLLRPESPATPARLTETDDRGEYRFGSLPAGRYTIAVLGSAAAQRDPLTLNQRLAGNAALTLPAATSQPLAVTLAPAEEKQGIDLMTSAAPPSATPPPPQNLPPGQRGSASVTGRITSTAGRPLIGTTVRVTRNGMVTRSGVTDAEGRFTVSDLPAGDVTVEATRPGFVTTQFGQPRANASGRPVTLREGERTERIDIAMPAGTALTGTVVDDRGEPVEGVAIRALQVRSAGELMMALPAPGIRPRPTDDRGNFRLWGVLPGRYIISATPDAGVAAADSRQDVGFAPVFYPGTTDVGGASTISVDIGTETTGLDLTLIPTRTFRVAGFAFDASGQPARGVLFFRSQRSSAIMLEPRTAQAGPDAAFSFANVPPGEYVVQVMSPSRAEPPANGGTPTMHFGMQYVTVADADPNPVTVRASAGSTLEGRIVDDGGSPIEGVTVWPFPTDFDRSPVIGSGPAGLTMLGEGRFRVAGVTGPRRFTLQRAPDGVYLKSAVVNGRDAVDVAFDFGAEGKPFTEIEVVVGRDAATLTGRVVDDRGGTIVDSSVVVFATERLLWYRGSQRVKAARPNQEGTFRITGLPPGDYFVVAVPTLEGTTSTGEWQHPSALEELSRRAQRITLGSSDTRTITPRLANP